MINNIIHFVFGFKEQTEEFLFTYYIAILSAKLINKPNKINFYYHYEPFGHWWDLIKPHLTLIKIEIPTHIGNKKIVHIAHMADIARMNILYQEGGIYMDIDTITIKPYDYLLNNKCVMGRQYPYVGLCNAIMMCEKKSEFIKIWLDMYEEYFNPNGWNESSIVLPLKLSEEYNSLITIVDPSYFFCPSYNEINNIFIEDIKIPDNLTTLHLWETKSIDYLKNITDFNYTNNCSLYSKILKNMLNYPNYDDINSFLIEDKIIFFDIFARNEELIIICPTYSNYEIFYDEIEIFCNNKPLKLKNTLYKLNIKSTVYIKIYTIDIEDLILHINVKYKNIDKYYIISNNTLKNKYTLIQSTLCKDDYNLINIFYPYYVNQGVEYFFIYYNDVMCDDLINLTKNKNIKLLEWNFQYFTGFEFIAQVGQINHALYKYAKPLSKNILLNDLDEYLYVPNNKLSQIITDEFNVIAFLNFWCDTTDNKIPLEFPKIFIKEIENSNNYPERTKIIYNSIDVQIASVHVPIIIDDLKLKIYNYMFHFKKWTKHYRTLESETEIYNIEL